MKSLEYNYQRMAILRDAKIFQVKRFIKLIQTSWRAHNLNRKMKAVQVISSAYAARKKRFLMFRS